MKFKNIRNFAFKTASETVIIQRLDISGPDKFGRAATNYNDLTTKQALLNNESKPTLNRNKAGQSEPLQASFYFKFEGEHLKITDRFTTPSDNQTWEIYKLQSEPNLGILEAFCYAVNG